MFDRKNFLGASKIFVRLNTIILVVLVVLIVHTNRTSRTNHIRLDFWPDLPVIAVLVLVVVDSNPPINISSHSPESC